MMLLSLLTVIVTVATPYSFTNTGVDIIYQTSNSILIVIVLLCLVTQQ